jgi:alpha-2-macroglobulin
MRSLPGPLLLLGERCLSCLVTGAALLLFLAGCTVRKDLSEGAQLVLSGGELGPTTTFEVRFDAVAIGPGEVGKTAAESPLLITPALSGNFTWLSERSGVFAPDEPLRLDRMYRLRLRAGLTGPDGLPLRARLDQTLRTPPFQVAVCQPRESSTNASAQPEIRLLFNAEVRPAAAWSYARFLDASGHSVAAEVRQGLQLERPAPWSIPGSPPLETWKEQFFQVARRRERSALGKDDLANAATNEVPNFLVITPRSPLPVGRGWRLTLGRGLPAAEDTLRLERSFELLLGDVTPFTVLETEVHNLVHAGKRVEVRFSKELGPELATNLASWLEITPRPMRFTAVAEGSLVVLGGDFPLEKSHHLTFRAGLPAAEPFKLRQPVQVDFVVPPIAPRLYFPADAAEQLAGGGREFRLLSANVPRVRVRAKLLEPETVIHGLRGYASYFKSWNESDRWTEPYRPLDYNLVPGQTVFDREFVGMRETDVAEMITLRWDDLLSGRKAGVVFLVAEEARGAPAVASRPGTQAMIQLTDLGLLWKSARDQTTVFVFSHTTGQPVPDATLRLLTAENQTLAEAHTEERGLASLPAQAGAHWLLARLGGDLHALEFQHQAGRFHTAGLPTDWGGDEAPHPQVMFFSDRGVYRPGETVHLKAIAREWREQGLAIPEKLAGSLKCVDARGRVFFETNATLNDLGSWAESVPLPEAVRGAYQARLNLASNNYEHSFLVQDFQPSAFEVKLEARPVVAAGEKIEVPVSARYHFGRDLARAKVHWSLDAEDYFFCPEPFAGFNFSQDWLDERQRRGPASLTLQGDSLLQDRTNLVLALDIPINPVVPRPRVVDLLVEVTDLNQQTLSRRAQFIRHSADFYLGLRGLGAMRAAGEALPLEVVAVGATGLAWAEPVKAHLTFQRREWQSVRVQGAGLTRLYRNECYYTNLVERDLVITPAVVRHPKPGETTVEGCRVENLAAPVAGEYIVEIRAKDAAGRETIASGVFAVAEKAQLAWDYRNETQIDLVPDQPLYRPGQAAQILVKTPISGPALVTVERERVLRSFVTPLAGNAPTVRVPLEPGDAPNVFVCVTPVRGAADSPRRFKAPEYRFGYCELKVEDPRTRLHVAVATDATNYLPGAQVRVAATIQDAAGAPADGAEATLWAVDEGILSLTEYAVPNPHDFFFAARRLAVASGISLPSLMCEDPERLSFHNKGYLIGDGASHGRLRKNFLPCAFWNATLRSDKNGRVEARFVAPDGLTGYRVLAVVHTARNQFGHGQGRFAVNKPLMLEPALPRFANLTDRLRARTVVFNQTDRAGDILVTLQLDDKATSFVGRASSPSLSGDGPGQKESRLEACLTVRVSVAAHGSAIAEFPIEFIETGSSKWIWRARFADPAGAEAGARTAEAGFTDSVQSTLVVGHVTPLLSETYLARVDADKTNLLAGANPQLLEGQGSVSIVLANTRLSELGEAVEHLLHYPYGCVEQTSSSLLPWIALRNSPAARFLHKTPAEISQAIGAGVERLLSMQAEGGGLGYWPGSRDPMLWGSAYGGMVLALAARQGSAVPKESMNKLAAYLSAELRGAARHDDWLGERCLALYTLALAGRAEPAYHEVLFQKREALGTEDRALLALAILESHGPASMVETLLQPRPAGPNRAADWFGCPARTTATRLLAWTLHRPADGIVDQLVADLMGGQSRAHWTTTQGNAWALLALTEYAARVEHDLRPAEGHLLWGGHSVPFRLAGSVSVFEHRFPLGSNLARVPLLLDNPSRSRLFTCVKLEARSKAVAQPRQDRGFSLQRTYARLDDENRPQELTGLRVGDRVLVTLHLNVRQPAHYLAIDDALPSVFEAINPEFKNQQTRSGRAAATGEYRQDWFSDFRELRTDRALFFANHLGPGNYTLCYLARVRAAGDVTAPAAKVEEMYHPERFGLSDTVKIGTQPLP